MASSKSSTPRWAALARDTNETKIQLALNLDGGAFPPETDSRLTANGTDGHASQASKSQTISINTGIGFLDHMLHALSKHAGWSLVLACQGDLHSESNLSSPYHCEPWLYSPEPQTRTSIDEANISPFPTSRRPPHG